MQGRGLFYCSYTTLCFVEKHVTNCFSDRVRAEDSLAVKQEIREEYDDGDNSTYYQHERSTSVDEQGGDGVETFFEVKSTDKSGEQLAIGKSRLTFRNPSSLNDYTDF